MANRDKGETDIVIDGKTYTLVLNTSAQIAAEDLCVAERADAIAGDLRLALRRIASVKPETGQNPMHFARDLQVVASSALAQADKAEMLWDAIFSRVMGGSAKYMRVLVWAMLREYHPEINTLEKTARFIDSAGGISALTGLMARANEASQPAPEDIKALGVKPARPRKAQAKRRGTGETSTAKPAA